MGETREALAVGATAQERSRVNGPLPALSRTVDRLGAFLTLLLSQRIGLLRLDYSCASQMYC